MLGDSALWWCWPTVPRGSGLKYPVADPEGEWTELQQAGGLLRRDPWAERDTIEP